ncbi:sulfotransferase family 2 domain-containing protein [Plastorhodobacter daqingensis]|uniref:Sulfotransferase family 2 domain-containing protein n=1 Tax=Plastorhodobacter daqingensis TaxID=1387281 RepID=A0ABW2UJV3_9RHOB
MSAFVNDYKISYFSVPKVACTSLKSAFFQLENDRAFQNFRVNGIWKYIHHFYPSINFERAPHDAIAGHARFALVRDPVERAVSCYRNRVVHYRELAPGRISEEHVQKGAIPDPDLEHFLCNLKLYRQASVSIRHHTDPFTFYLGTDPAYYDTIFAMRDIADFAARIARITGKPFPLPHEQTGGPRIDATSISKRAANRTRRLYEQDYEVFGRFM